MPALLLGHFSTTLRDDLEKDKSRRLISVNYPKGHVKEVCQWMNKGGRPWTYAELICKHKTRQGDLETFHKLVESWGIEALIPAVTSKLQAASKPVFLHVHPRPAPVPKPRRCYVCGSPE